MLPVAIVVIGLAVLAVGWVVARVSGRARGAEPADAPGDVSSGPEDADEATPGARGPAEGTAEPPPPAPTDGDRPADAGAESQQPRPSRSLQEHQPDSSSGERAHGERD